MEIIVSVGTNKVGSTCERSFKIEDDATDEKIDEAAWEVALDMINYTWRKEQP